MERLFRKLSPSDTASRAKGSDLEEEDGQEMHGAPRLDLDIRTSLLLPGLSQRFSVLVPKLSQTSETSLRSMLASQRTRLDGPSLTEEEEDLLLKEIEDSRSYRSHGFGTTSALRDEDYLRKVVKSNSKGNLRAKHRDPKATTHLLDISPATANASYHNDILIAEPPTDSRSTGQQFAERQSHLASLSPSQARRISSALQQIDLELRREAEQIVARVDVPDQGHDSVPRIAADREAQIAQSVAFLPRPVMTPSRTQPARHTPSSSINSASPASPGRVYIPGQPRPVRTLQPSHSIGPVVPASQAPPHTIPTRSSSIGSPHALNGRKSRSSSDSLLSDFSDSVSDIGWQQILGHHAPVIVRRHSGDLSMDALQNLSGICKQDLSTLQTRLIEKAKAERQTLRENSPVAPTSPTLPSTHYPTPPLSHDKLLTPPKSLDIFTPPPSAPLNGAHPDNDGSDPSYSHGRPSIQQRNQVPLDQDPNVRRDFEARIAAATATLHRTPTGSKLERRGTKKGALQISSPRLLSSTNTVPSTPLSPDQIDPAAARESEKPGGSARKMSSRWKNLSFKKRPSRTEGPSSSSPANSNLDAPIVLDDSSHKAPSRSPALIPSPSSGVDTALDVVVIPASRGGVAASTGQETPSSLATSRGKGLFRSLSRKQSQKAKSEKTRNEIVRRTLLMPELPITPEPRQSEVLAASPTPSPLGPGRRKQSIKRKPLNLTSEDEKLVSGRSQGDRDSTRMHKGEASQTGFGYPEAPRPENLVLSDDRSSGRRSSFGGSLYDMYSDERGPDDDDPPRVPNADEYGPGRAQGVEICEYADGQVVWSLVDGLRGEGESDVSFVAAHSRQTSHASSLAESNLGLPMTADLRLRHRDRDVTVPRPETFVYHAASGDVADLIDHLSRDLDAARGRIDIRHFAKQDVATSLDSDPNVNPPSNDVQISMAGSRHPASPNDFLPVQPAFARQGFAAHRAQHSDAQNPVPAMSGQGVSVEDRLQALLDKLKNQSEARRAAT